MSTKPTGPSGSESAPSASSASSASSARSSVPSAAARGNQSVVILLIVIAVLLAVIAAFLVRGLLGDGAAPSSPAGGAPAAGGTTGGTADSTGGTATAGGPSADGTSAPALSDQQAIDLIRSQARRDPGDNRARGEVDAPVVLILYSDFACPYCTLFAQEVGPELDDLVADGTLRIEWRDLAQITQSSPLAAQAGIAAANQGRFWEFHDAAYGAADPGGHPEYTEESLMELARQAGVPDLERFRSDMSAQETVSAVDRAKQEAYQMGITGTPFMFVGDTFISGYRPAEYVRATIVEQAAAASGS